MLYLYILYSLAVLDDLVSHVILQLLYMCFMFVCAAGTVWQVCRGTTRRRTSAAQKPTTVCWKSWSSGPSIRSRWPPTLELAWASIAALSQSTLCREVSTHTCTFMIAGSVRCLFTSTEFKLYFIEALCWSCDNSGTLCISCNGVHPVIQPGCVCFVWE